MKGGREEGEKEEKKERRKEGWKEGGMDGGRRGTKKESRGNTCAEKMEFIGKPKGRYGGGYNSHTLLTAINKISNFICERPGDSELRF